MYSAALAAAEVAVAEVAGYFERRMVAELAVELTWHSWRKDLAD